MTLSNRILKLNAFRALATVVLFLMVMAFTSSARADEGSELKSYVELSNQRLVEKLNQEAGLFERDPDAFYRKMEEAMTGFVDFRRIAARVMGRYARQTTPEQRDDFVERFKRSLFESYAQALVGSASDFQINVLSATLHPSNDDRGSVALEIITDSGNRYQASYSMYRNDQGVWLMENVIVEGVNIGLAFRDRFAQEMESRRGNIDDVITNWGDAVAALNLEEQLDDGADD